MRLRLPARPSAPFAAVLAALAVVAATAPLHAGKLYRWTDERGITHYGDHRPDPATPVDLIRYVAEPGEVARLRLDERDGQFLAYADNRLHGPVEVRLVFSESDNIVGTPGLPLRTVVGAGGSVLLSVLDVADRGRSGDFRLAMDAVPGDPQARAADVEYRLPLETPDLRIDQAYGGSFSHSDEQNRHAVDFATPEGSRVLAARAGVVMQAQADFSKAGLDRQRYAERANYIRILHEDGSMAVYAHLAPDGVLVRPGQRVQAGQAIGSSGNTGFSTGPHLHFVVQVNRGMRLESIPFRMRGPKGPLRIGGGRGG